MDLGGNSFKAGIRAGLGFAVPTFVLAISFGVLARDLGWGQVAPVVFSVVGFSGSAQFALASVLGAGGSALAAIAAALLVNARFAAMSVAVTPDLHGGRLRRALEAQAIVDASWALASRGDGRFDRSRMIGATLPQFAAWTSGTAVGVFAGGALGDPEALGLDVVFPGFFLALLFAELRSPRPRAAAAAGAAIAVVLTPIAPPGVPIIAACAAALLAWWRP